MRHAMGLARCGYSPRESLAAGVMMIPVPRERQFSSSRRRGASGRGAGVDEVQITARLHDFIAAWPEGSTLSGFYFCSRETPAEAEAALRQAHREAALHDYAAPAVAHPCGALGIWRSYA